MPNWVRKFKSVVKAPRRRQCWICGKTKRIEYFHIQKKGYLGRRRDCKDCHNSAHTKKRFETQTVQKYGISIESYNKMVEQQRGCCAICERPERRTTHRGEPRMLAIDHDHLTGRIRSLLCNSCNRAIGWLHDDPELIDKAAAYVRAHRKDQSADKIIELPNQSEAL